jgi:Fe2+ transport system protein FeoA
MITRLIDLGFVPGETVVVHQGIQLTTGALTATVQQTSFGLGWREASLVWVDILDAHR